MLNNYSLPNFKKDLSGGITAGIVTLPVALAYGQATELGPVAGVMSAIILGLVACLLGGTKTQISCPTGMVLVVVIVVIQMEMQLAEEILPANSSPSEILFTALPMILLTFLATGVFQLLLGAFKLGKYVQYIPYPVISGFMTGVGIIIILLQVNDIFGVHDLDGNAKWTLKRTIIEFQDLLVNLSSKDLIVGLGTVALILYLPRINKLIPSTLVAVVLMSLLAHTLGWKLNMVAPIEPSSDMFILGRITDLRLDASWHSWANPVVYGFTIAIVASINSLLSSLVADNMTDTTHDPNKELIGQGAGNLLAACFGAIPGAGATACTVTNINAGGRTRVSGIINALFLIGIFLFGGGIVAFIPKAVLGGVLVTIGVIIMDIKALRQIRFIPTMDTFIMLSVVAFTVYNELLYGVIIGLALASIHFMKKMADAVELDSNNAKIDRLVDQLINTFDDPNRFRHEVVVKNIKGPIFFGFASRFLKGIEELGEIKAIVFNLGGVPYIDQSGMYTIEKTIRQLRKKGVVVCLSEVNGKNRQLLTALGAIPDLVDDSLVFDSVEECVMWLAQAGNLDGSRKKDDLYIPSAYTPNGDGINDDWEIENIDLYPNCVVKIFDRDQRKVFENVGYTEKWSGELNGEILANDTYLYKIDLNGDGKKVVEGKVSIFR